MAADLDLGMDEAHGKGLGQSRELFGGQDSGGFRAFHLDEPETGTETLRTVADELVQNLPGVNRRNPLPDKTLGLI